LARIRVAGWERAPLHQDTFDRMLVAQAKVEGLTLVTTDIMMARYGSVGLRVVG
jgi:PIN domain nuclease of toxin-antitoxin system